jgi:hypothetical protein
MFVFTSILENGIDVNKELFIFQTANEQYQTCRSANYDAARACKENPYSGEYVDNALNALAEARIILDQFLECVNDFDGLKEKLEGTKRLAESAVKVGLGDDDFFTKDYRLLTPFVESIAKQAYLAPIVELAIKNR